MARPYLESLAEQTGETASLEVRAGREVLVVDEVVGEYLMSGVQTIGSRWPLHATSTGLAILAFSPQEEREGLVQSPMAAVTPHTITDPVRLCQELETICRRGYSVADEGLEIGLVAIGAPLHNHDGAVSAAISIAGPKLRLNPTRVAEIGRMVQAAAAEISGRLGYRSRK